MLCMNEFTLFVGGGGWSPLKEKQICNFVLFCWTLTNCRILHLIVLVVLECYWFLQKLGKWGLECVVWYMIVSTLIVGRTYSGGACSSNSWVGYPVRFLLFTNELCRVRLVNWGIGIQFLAEGHKFFLLSKKGQTGSGVQPASYSVGPTASFLGAWSLALDIRLFGRLIMSGVAPLLPPCIFIFHLEGLLFKVLSPLSWHIVQSFCCWL